jgi:ribA/ribD-fused uncharacterized protein
VFPNFSIKGFPNRTLIKLSEKYNSFQLDSDFIKVPKIIKDGEGKKFNVATGTEIGKADYAYMMSKGDFNLFDAYYYKKVYTKTKDEFGNFIPLSTYDEKTGRQYYYKLINVYGDGNRAVEMNTNFTPSVIDNGSMRIANETSDEQIVSMINPGSGKQVVPLPIKETPKQMVGESIGEPKGVKVISQDYGVVQVETNPNAAKKQEFLDLIKPQIQAQTYKENVGKGANQMFHFGKMWSRVTIKAKPIKINSFAPTATRDRLIDSGENAKGNSMGISEYTYAYHELDQNGNPLPGLSTLQPIIDEIQNALGIDMSNYDSVIGNIYQPNEFIFPHKDVTESKSAEGYPVIVYTMGANAGLGIVDNNKGKMTFANQYDDRYLRGNEKLSGYTNEVITKDGSIYTFGLEGKGRFQLTHSTPINDAKVGSQLPITLPNGNIITNYTITLTFRRAADLEPGMPSKPAITSETTVTEQPTSNEVVASIPQNLVSGIEAFGTKQDANAEAKKLLGNSPHSIDMVEAGIRTRTTRSVGEMEKYNVKVGDIIKQFGKSADDTTKTILTRVTAIHPKGTPGFLGTWNKEGWTQEGIKAIERYKDGAAAIEFEVISPAKDTINIYAGTGENAELSNFAIRPFKHLGIDFKSVEQAFQFYKTEFSPKNEHNKAVASVIKDTTNGKRLKELGREFKGLDQKVWDNMNSTIMKALLKDSFEQNPDALNKLLATGNATLTHTQESPKSKWRTEFPRLLMEVRQELGATQPSTSTDYNYNPSNVPEETREAYKKYVLKELGSPEIKANVNTFDFIYPDLTITISKDGSVSYTNVNQKIVDLSKTDSGYDIKFMVGLNKLAEEFTQPSTSVENVEEAKEENLFTTKINQFTYSYNPSTQEVIHNSKTGDKIETNETQIGKVLAEYAKANNLLTQSFNNQDYSKVGDRVVNVNNGSIVTQKQILDLFQEETNLPPMGEQVDKPSIFESRNVQIDYTRGQTEALTDIANLIDKGGDGYYLLAGYAGTGKTTIAENIAKYGTQSGKGIAVLAPTNKAAKVLNDKLKSTGVTSEATTIHKAIYGEPDPDTGEWVAKSDIKNSVIIVDESSMIAKEVMEDLLRLTKGKNNTIIFMGDSFQLEPVGEDSGLFKGKVTEVNNSKSELTEVKRQSLDSDILKVATVIRNDKVAYVPETSTEDFKITNSKNEFIQNFKQSVKNNDDVAMIVATNAERIFMNKLARGAKFGENVENIINPNETIISIANSSEYSNSELFNVKDLRGEPTKHSITFTDNYGKESRYDIYLAYVVNDNNKEIPILLLPEIDKPSVYHAQILKAARESNRELYNALSGWIFTTNRGAEKLSPALTIGTYGYAITAHKSQGSQWDKVYVNQNYVIPGSDAARWFYTAVTRAAKEVEVFPTRSNTIIKNSEIDAKLNSIVTENLIPLKDGNTYSPQEINSTMLEQMGYSPEEIGKILKEIC